MMWRPERPDRLEIRYLTVKKAVLGDRKELRLLHGWQNCAETFGYHAFAAAGTSLHQEVVHAGSGYQGGSFGHLLPFYIMKIFRILL